MIKMDLSIPVFRQITFSKCRIFADRIFRLPGLFKVLVYEKAIP